MKANIKLNGAVFEVQYKILSNGKISPFEIRNSETRNISTVKSVRDAIIKILEKK